jgi:hypothetical protein
MGAFYVNYTIRGADQEAVKDVLAGRKAFVLPIQNGCIVVSDKTSDDQDQDEIARLATQLSATLRSTVLAVLNHDDDILWFQLYEGGDLVDEYDSAPDYFDFSARDEIAPPKGGDAKKLCAAFHCQEVSTIEDVLRKDYVFATERHKDLINLLHLSPYAVGYGYRDLAAGHRPDGLSAESVTRLD